MKQQPRPSCGGTVVAGLSVLVLLAAELAAFALLAYRHLSWPWVVRGWDAAVWLTSFIPYAHLILLALAGWMAFRILGSTFNCFASLAEPEGGIGFLGWLGGVFGLALLATAALAVWFPERWMPRVEAWAETVDATADTPQAWLKAGLPYLPSYLLLCAAASLHCFRLMGDDRQRVRNGGRRSEAGMHWWEFLGGWPGSLVGMMVFRHKATSIVYLIGFVLAVGLHVAAVAGVLYLLRGGPPLPIPPVG